MVMQDGKFQLGENESAVAQAEQNLNNYKDQLSYEQQIKQLEELRDAQVEAIEARIQSLEEYYEYMEDYYDRQIEAMEDYYNRVQEQYEKQIEALQQELDTFKEGYQKSEDLDNARLAAEVLAANEEASVWKSRLENLATAITEYNRLLSLMGEEGEVATSGYTGSSVGYNHIAEISGVDAAISKIEGRASGDASFKGDEVALVGESPNTELVLGSRLNRSLGGGSLVNLSKGSGVVNAESTRTLAGLLNGLANPQSVSTSHTTQQTFTFGSISLPNVTNAETFVGALRDKFNNYSIQSTTIKK
jgi:tetratricopeptide (TPR) repeat protein